MRKILFIVCVAMFSVGAFAQVKGDKALGANLTYGEDSKTFAVGVKGQYNLTDAIRLEAAADYWLKKDGVFWWDVQANAHYLFNLSDKLKVYPIVGIGYMGYKTDAVEVSNEYVTVKSESSTGGDVFFNLGGGVQFDLTEKMFLSGEVKYQFKDEGQIAVSAGIGIKF